jgi:hypothetical protein
MSFLYGVRRNLGFAFKRMQAVNSTLLATTTPIYPDFGSERGDPIDRYYIERFLRRHAEDIRGEVLEASDAPNYTKLFGKGRVTGAHVMYPVPGFPGGTLVANLETGEGLPHCAYDCLVLTQVFQCIFDLPAAIRNSYAALKPGGVLLATFSGISQIAVFKTSDWGEYWRLTDASAKRLFGDVFGPENVQVGTMGNVLSACSFLNGLVVSDLSQKDLDHNDPEYQLQITVRAVKPVRDVGG